MYCLMYTDVSLIPMNKFTFSANKKLTLYAELFVSSCVTWLTLAACIIIDTTMCLLCSWKLVFWGKNKLSRDKSMQKHTSTWNHLPQPFLMFVGLVCWISLLDMSCQAGCNLAGIINWRQKNVAGEHGQMEQIKVKWKVHPFLQLQFVHKVKCWLRVDQCEKPSKFLCVEMKKDKRLLLASLSERKGQVREDTPECCGLNSFCDSTHWPLWSSVKEDWNRKTSVSVASCCWHSHLNFLQFIVQLFPSDIPQENAVKCTVTWFKPTGLITPSALLCNM